MNEKPAIFVLILTATCVAFSADIAVRDGFVITGADGNLAKADSNDKWFFEFDSDVNDEQGRVFTSGTRIELLPSSTLEKMTADTASRSAGGCRLWGKVARYKGNTFIFPIYFLPLSSTKKAETSTPQQPQSKEPQVAINELEDSVALPNEIVAKIETRKTFQPEQSAQQSPEGVELKQDTILPERTGFITEKDGQFVFELDALGQNVQNISFQLLPCQVLERLEQTQAAALDPVRFKIAGIVTEYKGRNYLLMQRAIRAYSHDNFGR